jgi:hypothetical protein
MSSELIMMTWERFQLVNLITGLVCMFAGIWIGRNRDRIRKTFRKIMDA